MSPSVSSVPSAPRGFALVDVETTGLDPRRHRVIEIAVSLVSLDGEVEQRWSSLVRPPGDTGPVHVHGITRADVADAPAFAEIVDTLAELLAGRCLVAHNARFDWGFLAHESARAGVILPVTERLCTVKLARALEVPASNLKLGTLAEHWSIPVARSHRAADDVETLTGVLRECLAETERRGVPWPFEACQPVN